MTASPARLGLNPSEVEASRKRHGANVLTPPPRSTWWQEYLSKFNDPVIRILMLAAALAIAVGLADGRIAEGAGILVAIFLATFLAYWNEHRAAREFDVLNRAEDEVPAKVVRDGTYQMVPKRDVVVGDLVFVEVGEEVPADGTLVEAVGLLVSEAKLTGESRPADKLVGGESAALLRGTTVADGYGTFEVTAVGDATEIGKTLRESTESTGVISPLNRQLARLSKIIGVVGFAVAIAAFAALVGRGAVIGSLVLAPGQWLVVAALVAAVGVALTQVWLPVAQDALALLRGPIDKNHDDADGWWATARPWLISAGGGVALFTVILGVGITAGIVPRDPSEWLPRTAVREFLRDFMIAVTIIVVAVPEGLAMSVTLSLAYSMRKMTAQQTLVRRMDATEAIGAATVICSDKTGTLTSNEMRVAAAMFEGAESAILPSSPSLRSLVIEAIVSNTTAHLGREAGEIQVIGNPTEGALLLWLQAAGEDYIKARQAFALRTQWTFSTERKFMATHGTSARGGNVLHIKGAPEVLLAGCDRIHATGGAALISDADRTAITTALARFQSRGMRTLGFAYRPEAAETPDADRLTSGLVWLGLVALADPVRVEVPAAVAACRRAGIAVKVVTGDTPATAAEVARQIGILPTDVPVEGAVLTGAEFAAMSDVEAGDTAERIVVLARARPADKLRLVTLLKARGHIVAVTGDGVNDGPALNYADVGLAMGKSGTSVAKEASDIVLLDDSFGSIVTAVKWGRTLYENIQRFILFQLTINVCALGLAVLGPFLGYELPLTVLQMLWVNLIMDTFAALALATEPPHPGVLDRPPRNPAGFIVTRPMARFVFGVGGLFLALLIGMILWLRVIGELPAGDDASRGGTLVFNAFVLLQFWNLFNAKGWGRRGSVLPTLGNNPSFLIVAGAILIGQVVLVQFGGLVFRTVPLDFADWAILLATTSVVFWVGEGCRVFGSRSAISVS